MLHIARYLSSADQLVVLVEGHTTQIGSFNVLNEQEGYVQNLTIQQQYTKIKSSTPMEKDGSHAVIKDAHVKRNPEKQAKRLVGTRDKSVYTFYLQPIGILRCVVLLFAVIALAVATRFQRKCTHSLTVIQESDLCIKVFGFNGGLKTITNNQCT